MSDTWTGFADDSASVTSTSTSEATAHAPSPTQHENQFRVIQSLLGNILEAIQNIESRTTTIEERLTSVEANQAEQGESLQTITQRTVNLTRAVSEIALIEQYVRDNNAGLLQIRNLVHQANPEIPITKQEPGTTLGWSVRDVDMDEPNTSRRPTTTAPRTFAPPPRSTEPPKRRVSVKQKTPSFDLNFNTESEEESDRSMLAPPKQRKKKTSVKLAIPDTYNGEKKGREARQWMVSMAAWLKLSSSQFENEEDAISYLLTRLTGKAGNWAMVWQAKLLAKHDGRIKNIQEFMDKFSSAFDDPDAQKLAERKIQEIKQTDDAASYTTEFEGLAADLEDWTDAPLMAAYRRGLNWKVKELLAQRETQPETLEAMIKMVEIIDSVRQENEASRPPRNQPSSAPKKTTSTGLSPNTHKEKSRPALKDSENYVSEEERQKRRDEGLCVKCGSPDHLFAKCPNGWKKARIEGKGKKDAAKVAQVEEESGKE